MKKIALILLILSIGFIADAQIWTNPTLYGKLENRGGSRYVQVMPTGCGAPAALNYTDSSMKMAAQYYDSCNGKFYLYSPATTLWSELTGGGGGSESTTAAAPLYLDGFEMNLDTIALRDYPKKMVDSALAIVDAAGYLTAETDPLSLPINFTGNETVTANGFYLAIDGGRFELDKGANVAAANDLTLGGDGNVFTITGNTQINAITTANWQPGSKITLLFTGTPTVKHNTAGGGGTAPLFLSGSADYTAAANDIMELVYDGTNWHETVRRLVITGGGRGEVNVGQNLGSGLDNYAGKSGSTLQFNTFDATHFDLASNLISLDATIAANISNGQTAFGWGNHASAGYLTSVPTLQQVVTAGDVVSDGSRIAFNDGAILVFDADNGSNRATMTGLSSGLTPTFGFSSNGGANWSELKFSTTGDYEYTWPNATGTVALESFVTSQGYLTSYTETDPLSWKLTGTSTLTGAATIAGSETNTVDFTMNNTTNTNKLVNITNSGTAGGGLFVTNSGNQPAIVINQTGLATGLQVQGSTSSAPITTQQTNAAETNNIRTGLSLTRFGGTVVNGFGIEVTYQPENAGGSAQTSNRLQSFWSNATEATKTSTWRLIGLNSGVENTLADFLGTGQLLLPDYASGTTFTGTANKYAAFDASGYLIAVDAPGGGGSTKFGKAGEDATAAEARNFTYTGFDFTIQNLGADANTTRWRTRGATRQSQWTINPGSVTLTTNDYPDFNEQSSLGTTTIGGSLVSQMQANSSVGTTGSHQLYVAPNKIVLNSSTANTLGLYFENLVSGSQTKMVYYNPTTHQVTYSDPPAGSGGEANTASNLGGGLANWDSKSGVDLRFNTFNASHFDLATNLISIDATLVTDIANGATAFSWGNHASAGYLTTVNNSNWSGTDLSVANGGTGASTLTGVLIGDGVNAITGVIGTAGQLLRRNAGNTAYEFFTPTYLTSYTETDPVWTAASSNYYTQTNLQTSGQASVHWDNITNEPAFLTSETNFANNNLTADANRTHDFNTFDLTINDIGAGLIQSSVVSTNYSELSFDDTYFDIRTVVGGGGPINRMTSQGSGKGNKIELSSTVSGAGYWAEVGTGGVLLGSTTTGTEIDATAPYIQIASTWLQFNNIPADNTAASLFGIDGSGNVVTRTVASLPGGGVTTFAALTDVNLTSLATNDFLKWDGTDWINRTPANVKTDLSLNNVENTALSTWAGSANITTVGTIASGTWGGTDISNTAFRQSAGLSVIGRSANTTGDVADITGTDGQVLRVSGTTLGFGSIDQSSVTNLTTDLSNKQPLDADLTTIAGLSATTDNFIVGVSSAWSSRTPAQVRTTLGLVIGTNVQAWDTDLDTWATKTAPSGTVIGTTDAQTLTNKTIDHDLNTIVDMPRRAAVSYTSPAATEKVWLFQAGSNGATATSGTVALRGSSPSVTYVIHYGTTYLTSQGTIVASNTVNTTGITTMTIGTSAIPANAHVWLETSAVSGTIDEFTPNLNWKQ